MSKPLEWWIYNSDPLHDDYYECFVSARDPLTLSNDDDYMGVKDKPDRLVHVIEYSAYKDIEEQLLAMKARVPMSKSKEPGGWARDFHGETHVIEYSAYLSAIRERDEARAEIAGG